MRVQPPLLMRPKDCAHPTLAHQKQSIPTYDHAITTNVQHKTTNWRNRKEVWRGKAAKFQRYIFECSRWPPQLERHTKTRSVCRTSQLIYSNLDRNVESIDGTIRAFVRKSHSRVSAQFKPTSKALVSSNYESG